MDFSVHGILQARILESETIPFPSPGDLPNTGIKPKFPAFKPIYMYTYAHMYINLFFSFLVVLGICYCTWAFSSCDKLGLLFVVMLGL